MNTISLSLNRIKYLFIEYFISYWKRDLIIFGALLLVKTFCEYEHMPFPIDELIVIIMSVILCGTFNYLSQSSKGMSYLLCPTNTVEKVIIRILLVHIYYTAILCLLCILSDFIVYLLNPHRITTFFFLQANDQNVLEYFAAIFAIQSIFIFASVYFKKYAILKTALFWGVLSFFIAMLVSECGDFFVNLIRQIPISITVNRQVIRVVSPLFPTCAYIIITIFFWFMSYLRLKETEV